MVTVGYLAVLAIDPAKVSGTAMLRVDGPRIELMWTAQATNAAARASVVSSALLACDSNPLIVVAEQWGGKGYGQKMGSKSLIGLGATWGRWLEQLEIAGVRDRFILRSHVGEWRAAMFGGRRRKGDVYKRMAIDWCRARWDRELDADCAEAACMGVVAIQSGAVANALPKRKRRGRAP